jgi:hypothetical protein
MLAQLSPNVVPLRMTFYWHRVAAAPDYYDPQVAAAASAGVPILGILGYSAFDQSAMPSDFDFTEISPFDISWHSQNGPLAWGTAGAQGMAKYVWNAALEDGLTHPRVVAVTPPAAGGFLHGAVNFQVPAGHSVELWARVGFLQDSSRRSRASFSITYLKGAEFLSLTNVEKGHNGTIAVMNADITSLAGRTIKLFFNVDPVSGYSPSGAVWQSAGVVVDGMPLTMSQVVGGDLQSVINYPPKDPDAFAAYASSLARRYPQIEAWEVWNEPNTSFFWRPAVDDEAYTTLLKKTYAAVKSANPKAKIILGGLSPGNSDGRADGVAAADFLSLIYQNGGGVFFDAVGYHAYGEGALEDWLADALLGIRYVMDSNGDMAKPVWITEIGCYTYGPGAVSEDWQAGYLLSARAFLAKVPYVERAYWYTLRDANYSRDPEKNYGLFRADGTPKSAVKSFAAPIGN